MPRISVIVPSYSAPRAHLEALYRSLLAQTCGDFEALIVDDGSRDDCYELLEDPRFRVLRRSCNQGPAVCRNAGAKAAQADFLFFTDTDCELAPRTLEEAAACLEHENASVGDTITKTETRFGRAVALLGFPGGGCIGFHNVWRVSAAGYASSFSSCNVAFRKELFEEMGGFEEGFPVAGGEDTVLARRLRESGKRLRYLPRQLVCHVERKDLAGFIQWQITRGRGNYYIKKHVPEVGSYLRMRLWTFRNSFLAAGLRDAPLVFGLLCLSVYCQLYGYRLEKRRVEE